MGHKAALIVVLLVALGGMALAAGTAAAQEQVLYSFYSSGGAVIPEAGVISDAAGNLYGTTAYGGDYDMGTVYELTPTEGGWVQTVLHSFNADGIDGFVPTGGLIFDHAGNLYGTTQFGGTGSCTNGFGCGMVFQLTPSTGGTWTENVIHDFTGPDGWEVHAGVVMDSEGNLYGTTADGGTYGQGTVYELSVGVGGNWGIKVLHQFTGGADGGVPYGNVTLDAAGNVYGMASEGGGTSAACKYGCGTVFELSPTSSGNWTGKLLHNFTTAAGDGHYPYGSLVFDGSGNLYGTTSQGGGHFNSGIVFELTLGTNGKWAEKVLHNFNEKQGDGATPSANLLFDDAGNLYSTTLLGGLDKEGTVFELSPSSGGWTETVLYNFTNQGTNGYNPNGGLVFDRLGNLYGATSRGGQYDEGTVFEAIP